MPGHDVDIDDDYNHSDNDQFCEKIIFIGGTCTDSSLFILDGVLISSFSSHHQHRHHHDNDHDHNHQQRHDQEKSGLCLCTVRRQVRRRGR